MHSAVGRLQGREHVGFAYDNLKIAKWFVLTNAAVVLSIVLILGAVGIPPQAGTVLFFMAIGTVVPMLLLLISKPLAKWTQRIRVITPTTAFTEKERSLVSVVENLARRAGLASAPEVGIYMSPDMNAFATGMNQRHSIVAFSSALLDKMDGDSIAAVAAHEISHIANGDMVTMALIQSAVNAIVMTLTVPVWIYKTFLKWISKDVHGRDTWTSIIIEIVHFVFVTILLFLGNLVVKFFSRHREFAADRYASMLTTPGAMSNALRTLGRQSDIASSEGQKAYATFKIYSPAAVFDIFATHPSIERRLAAIAELANMPSVAPSPVSHPRSSLPSSPSLPLRESSSLPAALPSAVQSASPPIAKRTIPRANMISCCGCGKELHKTALVCPECGAPQSKAPDMTTEKKAPVALWLSILALIFAGISCLVAFGDEPGLTAVPVFPGLVIGFVSLNKQRDGNWMAMAAIFISIAALLISSCY